MDVYTYVASCNPYQAKALLHKYGYSVKNVNTNSDLGVCLAKLVNNEGENALYDVLKSHPDKDVIIEVFGTKEKTKNCCGCNGECDCGNKKRYMNFDGNVSTEAIKSSKEVGVFIMAAALILAAAIIVKK